MKILPGHHHRLKQSIVPAAAPPSTRRYPREIRLFLTVTC